MTGKSVIVPSGDNLISIAPPRTAAGRKGGRQEEIFTEILLQSNLEDVARSLMGKIMEPLREYVVTGDSSTLIAKGGTISPDVEFDLEECLGEYRMNISYMVSNSKSGLRSASAHAMTLQVLDPSSNAAKSTDVGFELAMLEEETLDLLEHEMGHYYLQKMANAGSCIYYTDPRGYAAYFEDPQEIALHSKVIWNELKRSGGLADRYRAMLREDGADADKRFLASVRRTVEGRVPRLEWQVGVPGARLPKRLQKRYVDIIMKYYVGPFMERIRGEQEGEA